MANTFTYQLDDRIYINLTNECTNNCMFCIRNTSDGLSGYSLWLDREPEVSEVIDELKNLQGITEVVFCGFGEPLMRWKKVIEIAKFVKSKGIVTRINTNGQADLFAGKDIIPELANCIDKINISLNEVSAKDYNAICNPIYGENAYYRMLDFARRAKDKINEVTLSVVDVIGEDKINKAKEIAQNIGVRLRIRKYCNC